MKSKVWLTIEKVLQNSKEIAMQKLLKLLLK